MAKQTVVIQLVVDNRMIWQVKQDVPRENCRRMTSEELKAIGSAVDDVIADVITSHRIAEKATASERKRR